MFQSSYTIIVNIVDHQRKASPYQVTITEEKLSNRVAEVFENTGKPQELDFGQLFNTAVSDSNFPTRVAAQAIAKWDTLLIEAGYKGIEILFAISITLALQRCLAGIDVGVHLSTTGGGWAVFECIWTGAQSKRGGRGRRLFRARFCLVRDNVD